MAQLLTGTTVGGELVIVGSSLDTVLTSYSETFNTVADMIASTNLSVGDRVQTLGYYSIGDGGANHYEIVSPATGTVDGGTYINMVGTSTQAHGLMADGKLTVRRFGAKGDGTVDDSPAIQALVDHMKTFINVGPINTAAASITFEPGIYRIDTSINMTGIEAGHPYWYVDAKGAIFDSHVVGRNTFDLMGSRKCHWTGGQIVGDGTDLGLSGIFVGRDSSGTAADGHVFSGIEIRGYYSVASFWNCASEENTYYDVGIKQYSDNAYCMIQDGATVFQPVSDYIAVPTLGTPYAFNQSVHINADYRNTGATGSAVYMSRAVSHRFIGSYLVVPAGGYGVYLDFPSWGNMKNLDFDLHVESDPSAIFFLNADPSTNRADLSNFSYTEHNVRAIDNVFETSVGATQINFHNVDIAVDGVHPDGAGINWFSDPTIINLSGKIASFDVDHLQDFQGANISGTIHVKDHTIVTGLSTNGQTIVQDTTGMYPYSGNWTPVISDAETGGNLGTYTSAYGGYTKLGNRVELKGTILNVDITGMTGTNDLWIQGLPFEHTEFGSYTVGSGYLTKTTIGNTESYFPQIVPLSSGLRFVIQGSNAATGYVTVAKLNAGGTADIFFSITYDIDG